MKYELAKELKDGTTVRIAACGVDRKAADAVEGTIKSHHPEELTWAGMIEAARELGYDDYADAWARGMK